MMIPGTGSSGTGLLMPLSYDTKVKGAAFMAKIYGDEITERDQWNKLKGASLKDKLSYIWEYYHIHIIVIVSVIVFAYSMISSIIYNSVPNVVSGECYTGELMKDDLEDLKVTLGEKLGYEPKKYHIDISSTAASADASQVYTLQQKLIARIAAQDLDFLAAPEAYYSLFMSEDDPDGNAFTDLRTVLPEETFARLEEEGRIRYFENSYSEAFPYLIDVTNSELYSYLELLSTDCYLAVTVNAPHLDGLNALLDLVHN